MNKAAQKNFFLISFLPAIAYWYLESNYSLPIALAGGVILATLEIILEKIFIKHVHTVSKFNFFLIVLLGAIAFIGQDGIWFKLQPMFTGLGVGVFLIYRKIVGKSLMLEMMESMGNEQRPPEEIINTLEFHMAIFFTLYGLFMGGLAIYSDTSTWLFFKTGGFYIAFGVIFIFEFIYMQIRLRKIMKHKMQMEMLKRTKG